MNEEVKRFATNQEELNRDRQLSSLFSIISNNLMLAAETLGSKYRLQAADRLKMLCRKAKLLSKDLISNSQDLTKEELSENISFLKHNMLSLIVDLTEELSTLDSNKNNTKVVEGIVLARRLLRESQRGLITIQD